MITKVAAGARCCQQLRPVAGRVEQAEGGGRRKEEGGRRGTKLLALTTSTKHQH